MKYIFLYVEIYKTANHSKSKIFLGMQKANLYILQCCEERWSFKYIFPKNEKCLITVSLCYFQNSQFLLYLFRAYFLNKLYY